MHNTRPKSTIRSERVSVLITKGEKKELDEAAEKRGVAVSVVIRELVFPIRGDIERGTRRDA